ncbi:unnamed protein product [Urochloa humidicola]
MDRSKQVLERILKNQQTLAKQLEITGQAVSCLITDKQPGFQRSGGHRVCLMQGREEKEQTSNICSARKVCEQMAALEEDKSAQVEKTMFHAPMAVVWDDELTHNIDTNDDLLQQLAHGEEYLEAVCSVSDERPLVDVLWDEEMQSDKDMHDGLLQQLASGQEYFDSEQMALKVEHKVEEVDTDAIDDFLLGDLNFAGVVFDEMTHKDVIWDEKLSTGLNTDHASTQTMSHCRN